MSAAWQLMPGYEFFAYVPDEATARRLADAWAVMGLVISRLDPADDPTDSWVDSPAWRDRPQWEIDEFKQRLALARLDPDYNPDEWAVSAMGGHDDRLDPARFEAIRRVCREITGEDPGGESTYIKVDR